MIPTMPNGMPWTDSSKASWIEGRVPALVDFEKRPLLPDEEYDSESGVTLNVDPQAANLVTSLVTESWLPALDESFAEDGAEILHMPVLDIDIPMRLVPSTTPGHSHLYIDRAIPWYLYEELLSTLAECGIIEPGYFRASVARGYSAVRPPWVKKEPEPVKLPLPANSEDDLALAAA